MNKCYIWTWFLYECKIQLDFPDNASRNTLRPDFECHNCIIFPSPVGEKVISPG